MSNNNSKYVVTKNGVKVSPAMSLDEANAQASQLRVLTESQGEKATIAVVPLLMG